MPNVLVPTPRAVYGSIGERGAKRGANGGKRDARALADGSDRGGGGTGVGVGDTNESNDVFVRDRQTGTIERVSVANDGSEGNSSSGESNRHSISADGRYVVFYSFATNLVDGDTNRTGDVFVRDRETGSSERVSIAGDGSEGNSTSSQPSISADGRYVAFDSRASNLVDGDTSGESDIFVHEPSYAVDTDGDGVDDDTDNCPDDANALQVDSDEDLLGTCATSTTTTTGWTTRTMRFR